MKTYKLETKNGYRNAEHTVLYDTTVDGQPFMTGQWYGASYDAVLKVIKPEDVYQEVCNGDMYCNISGARLLENEQRRDR